MQDHEDAKESSPTTRVPIDDDGSANDKPKEEDLVPGQDDLYVLNIFDKDHDGSLNGKEMAQLFYRAGVGHFPWKTYDFDDDGKLSKKEFAQASMLLKEKAQPQFQKSVMLALGRAESAIQQHDHRQSHHSTAVDAHAHAHHHAHQVDNRSVRSDDS